MLTLSLPSILGLTYNSRRDRSKVLVTSSFTVDLKCLGPAMGEHIEVHLGKFVFVRLLAIFPLLLLFLSCLS